MTTPEETDALVLDTTCVENLTLYLVNEKKRMKHARQSDKRPLAIIAKGCDSRAITVLLQENHIKRDEVIVLGVSCETGGIVDTRKLNKALRGKAATSATFDGASSVKVSYIGGGATLPAKDVLPIAASNAPRPIRSTPISSSARRPTSAPTARAHGGFGLRREELGGALRLLGRTLERCIRCYACRAVCRLLLRRVHRRQHDSSSTRPRPPDEKAHRVRWISRSASPLETRCPHGACYASRRRCTDCGECERVCPVHIPLRLLDTMLERGSGDVQ